MASFHLPGVMSQVLLSPRIKERSGVQRSKLTFSNIKWEIMIPNSGLSDSKPCILCFYNFLQINYYTWQQQPNAKHIGGIFFFEWFRNFGFAEIYFKLLISFINIISSSLSLSPLPSHFLFILSLVRDPESGLGSMC